MIKKRLRPALAAFLAAAFALAACTNSTGTATGSGSSTSSSSQSSSSHSANGSSIEAHAIDAAMPTPPAGLEAFYTQKVTWQKCHEDFECAKVTVPLDYSKPEGTTITVALERKVAAHPIGSLLINPGGPGSSGRSFLANFLKVASPVLLEYFTVIGFDPRGVGDTAPIKCLSDAELGKVLDFSADTTTEAGRAQQHAVYEKVWKACEQESGTILPFVGTDNTARDMDVIRQVVGDPKLYYLGYSYGTKLGATYAMLFPKNVGRLVLDGAVAPNITSPEMSEGQAVGFEKATHNFLTDCLTHDDCPFKGMTVDAAMKKLQALIDSSLHKPLPVTGKPDRPLTQAAFITGYILPLYDNQGWPYLRIALAQALQGNGTALQAFSDLYNNRKGDTFENNSTEANWAINCADYPVTHSFDQWQEIDKKIDAAAPFFGKYMHDGDELCRGWPYQPTHPSAKITPILTTPVLVVGTTGDPATPYAWSGELAKALGGGSKLLTFHGEGHTAYGRSDACIATGVDTYLLTGALPTTLECGK